MDDWKTDANGKRYKETEYRGLRVREYEMTVNGLTQAQLHALNAPKNGMEKQDQQQQQRKVCPFSTGGKVSSCRGDRCAFHQGEGCGAFHDIGEEHKTLGRDCPLLYWQPCRRDCSFYFSESCVMLH